MLSIFLVLVILGLLVIQTKRKSCNWKNLPKGPNGLPILGNLLQLGFQPHRCLFQWATQYGPYFTLNLVGKPMLVVNSAKTIKTLFGNMASTGKYDFELFTISYSEHWGLLSTTGKAWLEHKKFTRKTLKDFGLSGGPQLDSLLLDECAELCDWIDKNLEKGKNNLYLGNAFLKLSGNAIWSMVSGSRDSKLEPMLENLITTFNNAAILTFMPWLKYVAPKWSGYTDYVQAVKDFHDFVRKTMTNRQQIRKNSPAKYVSKDLIDAYLDQVESAEKAEDSVFHGDRGIEESFYSIIGFIFAGSETTASTLSWLVSYLVAYPDVQDNLRKEVDRVIGQQQNPTLVEKHRMPYLEAVVYELLRITTIGPLGVIHQLLEPIDFDGYPLPKDMILLANCYYANHDAEIWGDPENFRPERFLEGEDAEQRKRLREYVMSFQDGKRRCPGEQVAKDEIFMVAAKLVQKYEFSAERGRDKGEYINPVVGYLLMPPKLNVVVKQRKLQ